MRRLGIKTYLKYQLKRLSGNTPEPFSDGYADWRAKRLAAIVDHYGVHFFRGKKILELGAGYGDIGAFFGLLGAQVTCVEGRKKNSRILAKRYPFLKSVTHNLDHSWPEELGRFDVILHLGVLYHLQHAEDNLRSACRHCDHLILETEVADSDDPDYIRYIQEGSYIFDQAVNGIGSRPSPAFIERILEEESMTSLRIADGRCNSGHHCYDWPITNSGQFKNGQRRMWWSRKKVVL